MPPRICILAETTPFAWVAHYVRAFRRCAEVFTVGPSPSAEDLARWGWSHLVHLVEPNDVTLDLGDLADPRTVLPGGWTPDLVVAIASNGRPACHALHLLDCPSVFVSVDSWQCLADFEDARYYDLVFVAQREFVAPMRAMGARHVQWLPLAADPEVHRPVEGEPDHDMAFVGNADAVAHRERAALLHRLQRHFTIHRENHVLGEDYCRAFARGKLAFNRSAMEDLNMRVFEALAMGRCLITDRQAKRNGLLDLFEENSHLVTYANETELFSKIRRFLDDETGRHAIAAAGRAEVLARHTYDHRVRTILDVVAGCKARVDPPAKHGLLACLPRIPGVVVDVGLASRASKYLLRRHGATRFIGLGVPDGKGKPSPSRYDEMRPWPGNGLLADTALVADISALPGTPEEALRAVHTLLTEGGCMVLALPAPGLAALGLRADNDALTAWLRARDFHLVHGRHSAGGVILAARKRTRLLREVLGDFENRFSAAEGAFEKGYLDHIPADL